MKFSLKNREVEQGNYSLDSFQRAALGGMLVLTVLTFVGANLQAVLWRSSHWLVSTVLPAVVVSLTNEERANLSEAPLRRSAVLDAAAQMKANDMAKNQYFAHYAPDGTSPWYWFKQADYTFAYAGENLAIHFTDSSEVVDAWMKSPKHRENIVNNNFTEIGVGTAKGTYEGYDTVYVVQLFGTPAEKPVVKTVVTAAPAPAPKIPAATTKPATTVTPKPTTATTATKTQTDVLGTTEKPVVTEVTAREEDTVSTTPKQSDIVVVPATNEAKTVTESENGVIVETELMASSSGLAIASIDTPIQNATTKAGLATQPNKILQIVYVLFGFIVLGLLIASVVVEARKSRYTQMAYGIGLLFIMAGLWYVNALLTTGATVL